MGDTWLALSDEHVNLDLRSCEFKFMLGEEITKNK